MFVVVVLCVFMCLIGHTLTVCSIVFMLVEYDGHKQQCNAMMRHAQDITKLSTHLLQQHGPVKIVQCVMVVDVILDVLLARCYIGTSPRVFQLTSSVW